MTEAPSHHFWSTCARPGTWLAIVCWLCVNGCATLPYQYSRFENAKYDRPAEIEIEYGRPQKMLDNIAWFTGIWSRVLTLNSRVNNHELSDQTKEKLIAYLEDNDLTDVLVRVNQYDPKGEWRRLRENDRVSPGWRYSVGLLRLAHYTILPGRVFGGDEYNPFTNSLYINSDVSAVALHEAAYAKDVHGRSLPGSYAFVNEVPLISLWRHTNGVNDVLSYSQDKNDWKVEHETYRVVFPQMGVHSTAMAGAFLPFWDGLLLSVAGATAGHITGRVVIAQREGQREARVEEPDLVSPPESEPLQASRQTKSMNERTIQVTKHETESTDESP